MVAKRSQQSIFDIICPWYGPGAKLRSSVGVSRPNDFRQISGKSLFNIDQQGIRPRQLNLLTPTSSRAGFAHGMNFRHDAGTIL